MQKFKVGDKVKVVENSYSGYWNPGYKGELKVINPTYGLDVDVEGINSKGQKLCQIYRPEDLELIPQVHPNQKLANEVANILRNAADFYLSLPNGNLPKASKENPWQIGSSYSCNASYACAAEKSWSCEKIERVIFRFIRSLGVNTGSMTQIQGDWSFKKKQETRHAWLYLAAQFAEENPDLVPTYGKKKVSV